MSAWITPRGALATPPARWGTPAGRAGTEAIPWDQSPRRADQPPAAPQYASQPSDTTTIRLHPQSLAVDARGCGTGAVALARCAPLGRGDVLLDTGDARATQGDEPLVQRAARVSARDSGAASPAAGVISGAARIKPWDACVVTRNARVLAMSAGAGRRATPAAPWDARVTPRAANLPTELHASPRRTRRRGRQTRRRDRATHLRARGFYPLLVR